MATGICFVVPRRVIGAVRGAFWRCCWWWVAVSRSISAALCQGCCGAEHLCCVVGWWSPVWLCIARYEEQYKDTKWKGFLQKKREFLPTILRSENFALKVAKPFVSGRFSQGRKRSEIGRKKVENYSFFSTIHLKNTIWYAFNKFNNSTIQHFNNSTNQHFNKQVFEIYMMEDR